QAALHSAKVRYDESLIRDHVKTPGDAARAVAEMLDQPDPPTAFFGTNNRITVGALQELWRRDSTAAIIGFDDFELSHLMPRPLTVVAYDTRELARTAAELLFRRIGGDRSWSATTVLPTRPLASLLRERGKDQDLKIKWGSLYTVVQNLEKHGFIAATESVRQGRRPERTVYAVTQAGLAELVDWMHELIAVPEREHTRFQAAL